MVTSKFFVNNLTIILFLYGLAYYTLGVAVLLRLRPSKLKIVEYLPFLAAYGIVHAVSEWLEMFIVIHPGLKASILFNLNALLFLASSTFFLLAFSVLSLSRFLNNKRFLSIIAVSLLIWIVLALGVSLSKLQSLESISFLVSSSRYIFYFTGSLLSGVVFIYQFLDIKGARSAKIRKSFLYAAIAFFANAIFAGLFVEAANFPPANFLNAELFFTTIGLPVEVIRGVLALLIAFFVIRGLDYFALEEKSKLEKLRKSEKAALKTSETLTKKYNSLYKKQKNVAAILQEGLLPAKFLTLNKYEIGIFYRSATIEAEVGGDFYDFIEAPEGLVHIVVGDISGKGVGVAKDVANVKSLIKYFLLSTDDTTKAIGLLNNALYKQYTEIFISFILITYDRKKEEMYLINAGHPPPLVHAKTKKTYYLTKGQAALAIMHDEQYHSTRIDLDKCDLLVFYTDGLIEARYGNDFFGQVRLKQCVSKMKAFSAQKIADNLGNKAIRFSRNVVADDILVLVIKET